MRDSYIDSTSDDKIQEQKDKLNSNYKKQKQKLQDEFQQKKTELHLLMDKYKKRQYISFIVGVIGAVIGAIGFIY